MEAVPSVMMSSVNKSAVSHRYKANKQQKKISKMKTLKKIANRDRNNLNSKG